MGWDDDDDVGGIVPPRFLSRLGLGLLCDLV